MNNNRKKLISDCNLLKIEKKKKHSMNEQLSKALIRTH